MKNYLFALAIVLLAGLTVSAQEPTRQPQPPSRTIVIDVDVIDFGLDPGQVEAAIRDRRQLERMTADGTVRIIARARVRGRSGQNVTTRMGQRVPIRLTSTSAQVQYENTGLTLNLNSVAVEGDKIDVKLSIELSAVVRRENNPDQLFVQRSVTDSLLLKAGEPTVLVSVAQNEGLFPIPPRTPGAPERIGENFVVVLTARFVD